MPSPERPEPSLRDGALAALRLGLDALRFVAPRVADALVAEVVDRVLRAELEAIDAERRQGQGVIP